MYKVKILTCYCGEPFFNILTKKLKQQKNVLIDHYVIKNLDLADAESEIYKSLINTNIEYDFVIKLDADMCPKSHYSIFDACKIADKIGKPRLTLPVLDLYTKSPIFGIHFISNIAPYSQYKKNTIPKNDLWIKDIEGVSIWHSRNTLFYHGLLPSEEQIFRFGYQRGRKLKDADFNHAHWQTAQSIHKNFKNNSNYKNKLMFKGLLIGLNQLKSLDVNLIKSLDESVLRKSKLENIFMELKNDLEDSNIEAEIKILKKRSLFYPNKLNVVSEILFAISMYKNLLKRKILLCVGNIKYQKIINKVMIEKS